MTKSITLDELKSIQLEILQAVHDFCIKNNIQYGLAFGTLIGAIRHKGFIPWDDDIDITMPRKDYELFVKSFKHSYYKVYDYRADKDYVHPFAKVADTRTMLEERANMKNIGINIDIFPLDPLFDTEEESAAFMKDLVALKKRFRMKILKPSPKNVWWKRIAIRLSKILVMNTSLKEIAMELNQRIRNRNIEKAAYVGTPADSNPASVKSMYKSELFADYIWVDFEGRKFYAPSGYDQILRTIYGDYMQLPPLEKRTSPHTLNKIYWLNKITMILALAGLCACDPVFDEYNYDNVFDYPLEKSSEYMIILGDVQEYTYYDKYAPYFMKSINWIRGMHQQGYTIDCVLQTGDITNTNEDWEYRVFRDYTRELSEEVLFIPVTGNHDYTWINTNKIYDRNSSLFTKFVSFPKTKDNVIAYFEQDKMDNIIVRNRIKGKDVFILALEFAPRPEVIDWANQYIKQNTDKLFILLTHEFLSGFGVRETNNKYTWARLHFEDRPSSTPEEVWQNLVYPNDNIRAVICGHNIFSSIDYSRNITGRKIPQMLFNLQNLRNGGDGALLLWEIPDDGDSIEVSVINTLQNMPMDENHHEPMCDKETLHYKISIL